MTATDLNRFLSWPFMLAIAGHGASLLQGPLMWVVTTQHAVPIMVLVVAAVALGSGDRAAARSARLTVLRCAWAVVVVSGAVAFCFPLVSQGLHLLPEIVMLPVLVAVGMGICALTMGGVARLERRPAAHPVAARAPRIRRRRVKV